MGVYHQMGHHSANLLGESNLARFTGAIVSPTNEDVDHVKSIVSDFASAKFEIIFDPQLYYPNCDHDKLRAWPYFPEDVSTADHSQLSWWQPLNVRLANCMQAINPHSVCSPTVVPKVYSAEYYALSRQVASDLQTRLAPSGIGVLQTLLVRIDDLSDGNKAPEIASIVSDARLERVFLVLVSDVEPRRELSDTEAIKGAMRLIHYLEQSGIRVLVGFSSSDILLWKFAGASACATGKFFNLRRFTPSRWEIPPGGGGQLPYWFEESLMAYLRESDVVRVRVAGVFSEATRQNPYTNDILVNIDIDPENPWLGKSWRQYLYWFADFESRLSRSLLDPKGLLRDAERLWSALDQQDILMEERQNDGAWLRSWRRALAEAFPD